MTTGVTLTKSARPDTFSSPNRRISGAWLTVWGALWLLCAIPVAQSWVSSLSDRPWRDSVPQFVAVAILVIGFTRLKKASTLVPSQASWVGLACLCALSIVHAFAAIFHLPKIHLFSFIILTACLLWALKGRQQLAYWLPLFMFSFFVSPEMTEKFRLQISLPLQLLSTSATVWLGHLFIPITGNGHFFYINGTTYDVEPGCSGLNMWIGFLFVFMLWQVFDRFKAAGYLAVLPLVLPLTLAINIVRLFITALLGYYTNQAVALSWHTNLEYGLVPLGMYILWLVGKNFRATR